MPVLLQPRILPFISTIHQGSLAEGPYPVTRSDALAHIQISEYLQKIITDKIAGIALGCFEQIVHCILMAFPCFYPDYKAKFLHDQASPYRLDLWPVTEPNATNNIVLEDRTAKKSISVMRYIRLHPDSDQQLPFYTIQLNGHEIAFSKRIHPEWQWTSPEHQCDTPEWQWNECRLVNRDLNIRRIRVEDGSNFAGQIKITEFDVEDNAVHEFTVDTNKEYTRTTGMLLGSNEETHRREDTMYLTEEAIVEATDEETLQYMQFHLQVPEANA